MLSDKEILEALSSGRLEIEPMNLASLGPVSYDLITRLDRRSNDVYYLVSEEKVKLDRTIVGMLSLRSRSSKMGLFASFSALVDPGYEGHLLFLLYVPNRALLKYYRGLFQIMFFNVGEVNVAYDERATSTAMGRENFGHK